MKLLTVRKLVEALQELPQDAPILFEGCMCYEERLPALKKSLEQDGDRPRVRLEIIYEGGF